MIFTANAASSILACCSDAVGIATVSGWKASLSISSSSASRRYGSATSLLPCPMAHHQHVIRLRHGLRPEKAFVVCTWVR